MNPLKRLTRPLGDAVRVFFKADLTLRREEGGLQLVLQERGPDGSARESPEQAKARREREQLALMQAELAQVLDEQPGARQALRHLVYFEAKFRRKGLRALHGTPLPLLSRALEQFEALVVNWSPVGLATLRSKMAVAVIQREGEAPEPADACGPDTVAEEALLLEDAADGGSALPLLQADPAAELAAAYAAALGTGASPAADVELQGELGSRSTPRPPGGRDAAVDLRLRELQP